MTRRLMRRKIAMRQISDPPPLMMSHAKSILSDGAHSVDCPFSPKLQSVDDDMSQEEVARIDSLSKNSQRLSSPKAPPTLRSMSTTQYLYIGKNEDDRWWKDIDQKKDEKDVYSTLIKNIGIFRWQTAQYVCVL